MMSLSKICRRERGTSLESAELGAALYVPPQAVLNGSVDVIQLLNAIPREAVRRMQETIAAHAHVLVYGMGERGVAADAVDRLLQVLKDEATRTPTVATSYGG